MTLKPWRMDMGLVMGLKTGFLGWMVVTQTPSLGSHLPIFAQDYTLRIGHSFAQSRCLICVELIKDPLGRTPPPPLRVLQLVLSKCP